MDYCTYYEKHRKKPIECMMIRRHTFLRTLIGDWFNTIALHEPSRVMCKAVL